MRKIEEIRNNTCTGCMACANVCPVNAITMIEDERGFYKPKINLAKCINCGMCDTTCPILNTAKQSEFEPKLYAMWADDKTRLNSSSGGAFTVLAENVIESGGVVFGAVWGEDFFVYHKVAENKEQLEALKKSKYVQSYIGTTFRQVESYLLQNRQVLFVGTGCQVGGLKKYIERKNIDDKNLVCIDLWCFQTPPHKLLKRYLKDNWADQVEYLQFRTKKEFGFSSDWFTIKLKGQNKPEEILRPSFWFKGYFQLMYESSFCERCKFQTGKRVGDISIGDYWGIENYDKSWNDGKGTSMIQINSQKGAELLKKVYAKCKRIEETPLNWIREGQSNGKHHNPNQQLFYDMIDQDIKFNKAVEMALAGKKFDIGMACVQVYQNYGSAFTNYALYKTLKDYGKEVLIINQPLCSEIKPNFPLNYIENPFKPEDCVKFYNNQEEMKSLNKICKKFLVGSDQLFNYEIYKKIDGFVKLDWVDDEHEKVCYSTSFGTDKLLSPADEQLRFKKSIRRFSHVSFRESFGVDLAKKYFQILSDVVVDPVFLCDKKHYLELISHSQKSKNSKMFCYVLDPNHEKENIINIVSTLLKTKPDIVTDMWRTKENVKELWSLEIMTHIKNEDWIKGIYESDYVVTDSFHGLCFSIIFNKQVLCLSTKTRGNDRALNLLKLIGYQNRIISQETTKEEIQELLKQTIDYDKVNKILEQEIEISRKWFEENVIK